MYRYYVWTLGIDIDLSFYLCIDVLCILYSNILGAFTSLQEAPIVHTWVIIRVDQVQLRYLSVHIDNTHCP